MPKWTKREPKLEPKYLVCRRCKQASGTLGTVGEDIYEHVGLCPKKPKKQRVRVLSKDEMMKLAQPVKGKEGGDKSGRTDKIEKDGEGS